MHGPQNGGPMRLSVAERQAKEVGPIMDAGFYIASLTSAGEVVHSSSNVRDNISYPTDLIKTEGRQDTFMRTENGYREAIHRGPGPAFSVVLIGAPTDIMYADLAILRWQLIGAGLAIVLFAYFIGWLLVSKSLMPIQSISQTAAHIASGHLYERIDISDTETELGQMGEVLNNTFEKLENAFDQQIRFTADASHELRTPIAVILAKCQFAMMRERDPEKYKETIKTCEASAQHIRGLVESLLELARVDSGEFRVIKREADLATVANSCTDLLSTLAEEKEIQLTVESQEATGQFDPDRIQQVMINLLSNAIKYTQNCGLIRISTALENASCVLRIEDSGPGISAEHLPHLFDRFYRSSDERSDDRRSTGLGLAITKAIVDAHHGTIDVVSELGKGTCFTVRLPA
jgi:heavy metal sensor kinase